VKLDSLYYNLYWRHGSLRKELNVKTPRQAIEKWDQLEPKLFKINPAESKNNLLNSQHKNTQLSSTTL
jgi:hypothetical protein